MGLIVWTLQAVNYFDFVSEDGHGLKVYFSYTILNFPKIIAVSKTFTIDKIYPLIDYGHLDFGENKVQEAIEKWSVVKEKYQNLNLHMVGRLQTNKVKFALPLFDYIHSLDNLK